MWHLIKPNISIYFASIKFYHFFKIWQLLTNFRKFSGNYFSIWIIDIHIHFHAIGFNIECSKGQKLAVPIILAALYIYIYIYLYIYIYVYIYKVAAKIIGPFRFLAPRALNFEASLMKMDMYVYFSYRKIISRIFSKNCQKLTDLKKVMKFYWSQKNTNLWFYDMPHWV